MSTHRVRTNYFNPFIVIVWVLPVIAQISPRFSVFNHLKGYGFSLRFVLYTIGFSWAFLLFILEYYRGLKYIDVEITNEGISTNWFYSRGSIVYLGQRVERMIKWEDIERFDNGLPFGGQLASQNGFVIKTKNNDRLYFIAYTTIGRKPKGYKAMKADFDAHYEEACKKGLIVEKTVKPYKEIDFPDI